MDDALHFWKNREMPATVKNELSRSKLSRLETGDNAKLSPFAKAHLADMYDQLLSTLDEQAAAEYRELTQAAPIRTCLNGITQAA